MEGGLLATTAGLVEVRIVADGVAGGGKSSSGAASGGAGASSGLVEAAPAGAISRSVVLSIRLAGDPLMLAQLSSLGVNGAASLAVSKSLGQLLCSRASLGDAPVHAVLHVAAALGGDALVQFARAFLTAAADCGYSGDTHEHLHHAQYLRQRQRHRHARDAGRQGSSEGEGGDADSEATESDSEDDEDCASRPRKHDSHGAAAAANTASRYTAAFGPAALPEVPVARHGNLGVCNSDLAARLQRLAARPGRASGDATGTASLVRTVRAIASSPAWECCHLMAFGSPRFRNWAGFSCPRCGWCRWRAPWRG
jgi:hypothetical protein